MDESKNPTKSWYEFPITWLIIFIFINLVIGIFIVSDYGISSDEFIDRLRSLVALKAFSSIGEHDLVELYLSLPSSIRFYGTAQGMIFEAAEQALAPILGAVPGTIRHYGYFVSFQVAIISIYYLSNVFTSKWVSLAVSIIFGTQPLLFGHAFINPKDIPLLAVFTAVVAAGFHLSKRLARYTQMFPIQYSYFDWATAKVEIMSLANRKAFIGVIITTAISTVIWVITGQIIFVFVPIVLLIGSVIYLIIYFRTKNLRISVDDTPNMKIIPQERPYSLSLYLAIVGAGGLWGFAIATRAIGLAAGGIVFICLLLEFRRKAVFPLILYTFSAGLICYISWPFLWAFGFSGLIESIDTLLRFPSWDGVILFEGKFFPAKTLPPYYMIKLIALQLTIPVVLFSILGGVLALGELKHKPETRLKVLLLFAWFSLPVLVTSLGQTIQYDNFRQFLFILPPIFVFFGIFLGWVIKKIKKKWITLMIIFVCTLPAIMSLAQLHPYQYIYYNGLNGGVDGAFRNYNLDYWMTSYMYTADWIDENIPPGSSILLWDWAGEIRIRNYLENDYNFIDAFLTNPEEHAQADYVLVTTELHLDEEYNTTAELLFLVEKANVPLAKVFKIQP